MVVLAVQHVFGYDRAFSLMRDSLRAHYLPSILTCKAAYLLQLVLHVYALVGGTRLMLGAVQTVGWVVLVLQYQRAGHSG